MDIEKIVNVKPLAYQGEEGEQKIYILPDKESVEQLLIRLKENGVSDTAQISLSAQSQVKEESRPYDTLLDDMAARLQAIADTPPPATTLKHTMGEVEQLLGNYLAVDGEQKVYVLPSEIKAEQILGNLAGLRTGEIKQSQMWRKTDVTLDNKEHNKRIGEMTTCIQEMDKRIRHLEVLLQQAAERDCKGTDE